MSELLDRWATGAAARIIAWLRGRVDPAYHGWVEAFAAECDDMESGWRRLCWALGGLSLVWSYRPTPAPRLAGIWSAAVDPRLMLTSLYRSRGDVVAFTTTLSLLGLVVVLTIFAMPVFQAMLDSADLTMPLAARVVLTVIRTPFFFIAVLLAPLFLLYRARKVGSAAPIRRALPIVNFVSVVALIGLTSGIFGFLVNYRPVFRAAATKGGWSPPAAKTARVLPTAAKR